MEPSKDLAREFIDPAMFEAAPIKKDGEYVTPKVHLLWMTPDPLGAIAAMCRMYEGIPTYSLTDITDDDRRNYLEQVQKTHLKAPLEAVKFHFFIEGVDRAFTHQMVRQRTAVYAQESMRFAVKENLADEASWPPSLQGLGKDHPARAFYKQALDKVQESYDALVGMGVPAEDARGLLPHATTTRLNYVTDLRALSDHAGNRLCTQAQFVWRLVFTQIVNAIRQYGHQLISESWALQTGGHQDDMPIKPGTTDYIRMYKYAYGPDFEAIADSNMFRPVCYPLGHCPFTASFDRACTIRDRVQELGKTGVPSSEWHNPDVAGDLMIDPLEWLADPAAARRG